jgi:hypothetical protein
MTQFQEEFLKDQEDNLSVIYSNNIYSGPDPDDDDWVSDDDDEDFDDDADSDVDEELVNPNVIPDTADLDDEDDEGTWADEDEDDDLLSDEDEDDEDITSESDSSDTTTEADRIERENLGSNVGERPYGRNRRTGRMIDHEPGSTGTGTGDPNL